MFSRSKVCRALCAAGMVSAAAVYVPVASATPDCAKITVTSQTVAEGTQVQLNGTPSKGDISRWEQIAGPAVTLSSYTDPKPTFIAPEVGPDGVTLTFKLTVTGCSPNTTTTNILVTNVLHNQPPVASATAPAVVNEGDAVKLDGSASSDADGDVLSYAWTQTDGPNVTLSNANTSIASFVAPNIAYPNGVSLTFRLTVSDGALDSTTDKTVSIKWTNDPPVAKLSCTDAVDEGQTAKLDGTGSTDDDNGIVSYTWQQLSGPPDAGITGLNSSVVTFVAPKLGYHEEGALQFELTTADSLGLNSTDTCTVLIRDITPPVFAGASDKAVEATSSGGASVTYAVSATDAVDGDVSVSCTPSSGSTFPLGTTSVSCSAQDIAGNSASANFNVSVVDTTPPSIAAHNDVTTEATGSSGASVVYTSPSATDIVDGAVAVTCLPVSGGTFPLGKTTVSCSASDKAGNKATSTFAVSVVDTTPPTITPPATITAEATGPSGAAVTYSATANDLVDGSMTPSCTPASGSTFALGQTTVSCSATDKAGNAAHANFTVSVVDTTPPAIAPHTDVTAYATSNSTAVVTYTPPTASDLVDGNVSVTCSPASGSTFSVGSTKITCSAKDARNNASQSSFNVVVSYDWNGFFRPVDNLPTLNVVKAGSAVPMKFSLGGNQGVGIFAAGYPVSSPIACNGSAVEDGVEETVTAGSSTLTYDATVGQYIYVWKTDKLWAGTCRQFSVKLTDGAVYNAQFKLTK